MREYKYRENINDNDGNTVGVRERVVPNNIVEQIKADVIEELLKQVKKEEMWLLRVVGSNQNINIAFSGIYAKAERLKSQDSMK